MPRGGPRIGAGRKPKDEALKALHGSRRRAQPVVDPLLAQAAPPAVDPPVVDPPPRLRGPARAVWYELAPFARGAGTLTAATAAAFSMLCQAIALERTLARRRDQAGSSMHRGMMQRVEVQMTRFGLAPVGKTVPAPAAPPADPFAEFDRPGGDDGLGAPPAPGTH